MNRFTLLSMIIMFSSMQSGCCLPVIATSSAVKVVDPNTFSLEKCDYLGMAVGDAGLFFCLEKTATKEALDKASDMGATHAILWDMRWSESILVLTFKAYSCK